ncbi:hypothetical protein G8764_16760 [Pseudomaricurvus alcaniphilus]|uniref:hypothetical protein n=1 Tax=Pseudomaricurvus alcaniphilus TaxID=1166482 RepID=UPI00140CDAF3|nr:hypothetical protein [Pseudomaricurvus alcaniphilus]NHN38962.1 hypothetical protein [Pseudomaricurvus alcaniphilus]
MSISTMLLVATIACVLVPPVRMYSIGTGALLFLMYPLTFWLAVILIAAIALAYYLYNKRKRNHV